MHYQSFIQYFVTWPNKLYSSEAITCYANDPGVAAGGCHGNDAFWPREMRTMIHSDGETLLTAVNECGLECRRVWFACHAYSRLLCSRMRFRLFKSVSDSFVYFRGLNAADDADLVVFHRWSLETRHLKQTCVRNHWILSGTPSGLSLR